MDLWTLCSPGHGQRHSPDYRNTSDHFAHVLWSLLLAADDESSAVKRDSRDGDGRHEHRGTLQESNHPAAELKHDHNDLEGFFPEESACSWEHGSIITNISKKFTNIILKRWEYNHFCLFCLVYGRVVTVDQSSQFIGNR